MDTKKTDKNILIAFMLNLIFSIVEFIGGIATGSIAIISDSIHDFGDAISIGIAYILENKSKNQPDDTYTYGYLAYSVLGSAITTIILATGSIIVILNAVNRIFNPVEVDTNNMILLAILGFIVNLVAANITHGGHSLNEKAVNLHMLEDVLSWIVVLIGAVLMKYTNISIIDPILSILVAAYIFYHSMSNLMMIINIYLGKIPGNMSTQGIKDSISSLAGVIDVHHIHIWTIDGIHDYATMHIVTDVDICDFPDIKKSIKLKLLEYNISHVTIELERPDEDCGSRECKIEHVSHCNHSKKDCGHIHIHHG